MGSQVDVPSDTNCLCIDNIQQTDLRCLLSGQGNVKNNANMKHVKCPHK